jgi:hypothetical protein
MPLAAGFFAAWVAVPLWLVFKHSGHAAMPAAVQAPAKACPAEPAGLAVVVAAQPAEELAGV